MRFFGWKCAAFYFPSPPKKRTQSKRSKGKKLCRYERIAFIASFTRWKQKPSFNAKRKLYLIGLSCIFFGIRKIWQKKIVWRCNFSSLHPPSFLWKEEKKLDSLLNKEILFSPNNTASSLASISDSLYRYCLWAKLFSLFSDNTKGVVCFFSFAVGFIVPRIKMFAFFVWMCRR